jgi:hypothetical protein
MLPDGKEGAETGGHVYHIMYVQSGYAAHNMRAGGEGATTACALGWVKRRSCPSASARDGGFDGCSQHTVPASPSTVCM